MISARGVIILNHRLMKENENCSADSMTAGGYVYPYIEHSLLERAVAMLGELLVFSCGFTFEGNLILPSGDDRWLIRTAKENNMRPVLVLTPFFRRCLSQSACQGNPGKQADPGTDHLTVDCADGRAGVQRSRYRF